MRTRRVGDRGHVWRDAPPSDITVTEKGLHSMSRWAVNRPALRTPLAGAHQASNALLALLMLAQPPERRGRSRSPKRAAALAGVRLPGRFHREGRFIFDVAHNPDGAAVLAATVKAVGEPRPWRRCSPC